MNKLKKYRDLYNIIFGLSLVTTVAILVLSFVIPTSESLRTLSFYASFHLTIVGILASLRTYSILKEIVTFNQIKIPVFEITIACSFSLLVISIAGLLMGTAFIWSIMFGWHWLTSIFFFAFGSLLFSVEHSYTDIQIKKVVQKHRYELKELEL